MTRACCLALGLTLASTGAFALSLGRMTVQSAIGEPLLAEIDIPELTADEASSLRAGVAPPEAFRTAGLEYNALVASLQVSIQRRPDGRAFLRLVSSRAVADPFVDLLVEATWANGKITRDYTLLIDPPSVRRQAVTPTPALTGQQSAPTASRNSPNGNQPATEPKAAAAPRNAQPGAARVATPAAGPATAADRTGEKVTVQSGDTAGKIAAASRPAGVSLDQMLVALLQNNPGAFSGGNINRLKAGALIELPSTAQASSVPAGEAKQIIATQSSDFNAFRRKLAENAPAVQTAPADRQASGSVQTTVQEKAATPTPDRLTLSKAGAPSAAEDAVAKDRQTREAAQRAAELQKNIADLSKLAGNAAPAGQRPPVNAPAVTVAAAAPVVLPAPPVIAAATPPLVAATPVIPASSPAAPVAAMPPASAPVAVASSVAAPVVPVTAVPAPAVAAAASATKVLAAQPAVKAAPAEDSLIDELLANPTLLLAGGALVLLLAGGLFLRSRRNRDAGQVDSSFLESRASPDSFFGASGGQRIDTAESNVSGSSMAYSPSQVDAAGEVDPVAEAEVYLAYGRDLQAEEILCEAMQNFPKRLAIHIKLLEIYAKRHDAKSFEKIALEAHKQTDGTGPEWAKICALGLETDPENSLYRAPVTAERSAAAPVRGPAFAETGAPPLGERAAVEAKSTLQDAFDLDLDLSPPSSSVQSSVVQSSAGPSAKAEPQSATIEFDLPAQHEAPLTIVQAGSSMRTAPKADFADLMMPDVDIELPKADAMRMNDAPAAAQPLFSSSPTQASSNGMLEFDLDALSMDLPSASPPDADESSDPLHTKLALAEEFLAIGDDDGARVLAEEVIAQASGALKRKAQSFVSALS
ncbi:MAG: FimV/HubP family polar landmark protein [Pseudomonadota bacterium]